MDRLEKQIAFIKEIDKLKDVYRQSYLLSQSRSENSAEHCWHVAMMATLLSEYAETPVDVAHVVELLMVHDLVEIDAGDTFCYDEEGNLDKEAREMAAADRIFSILPEDQEEKLMLLWREFETAQTPEARFANALDRLMPLMHNFNTSGRAWREHGVRKSQVVERNQKIALGSQTLWDFARNLIDKAVEKGFLAGDED